MVALNPGVKGRKREGQTRKTWTDRKEAIGVNLELGLKPTDYNLASLVKAQQFPYPEQKAFKEPVQNR